MTYEQAVTLVKTYGSDYINHISEFETKEEKQDFQKIYDEARRLGLKAGKNEIPVPMVVVQHEDPLNDNSKIKQTWRVDDGCCGFAWVNVSPATQPFARWLKKTGIVKDKAYEGGYNIWISEFGQSMTRKSAMASEMACYFEKHGIKCYSNSRMD